MHVFMRQLLSSSCNHTAAGASLDCCPSPCCSQRGSTVMRPHKAQKPTAQVQPVLRCNLQVCFCSPITASCYSPPGECSAAGLPPSSVSAACLPHALTPLHLTPAPESREAMERRRKERGDYFRAKMPPTPNLRVHTWLPPRTDKLCLPFPSLRGCGTIIAAQGAVSQSPTLAHDYRWDITGKM